MGSEVRHMQQELTYSYRIYPNKRQQAAVLRVADVARCYYNELLRERETEFRETGIWTQKQDIPEEMEDYAREHDVDRSVLKHAAAEYERAFRHYQWIVQTKTNQYKETAKTRVVFWPDYPLTDADLKGAPREKPIGSAVQTFSLSPALLLFQDNAVCIPNVGWVRAKFHRLPPIDAKIDRGTVVAKSSGKFYLHLNITLEVEDKRPERVPEKALGVVFSPGLLAIRSDGIPVAVRHSDPDLEAQIQRAYRALKRKHAGSNGYKQQRQKLAKLIEKQTARRRDALHKASREIMKTGTYVGVQVPEVKKTAKRNKRNEVDSIVRDEAWYTFYGMLRYKGNLRGLPIYPIPRAYPIFKTCAACGARLKQAPKTQAWLCPKCGTLCGKGGNAARNIQHFMENEIREWKAKPPESDSK